MNKWECDHPGCGNAVVGTGGAIGLRAVGWYFRPGSNLSGGDLYCPAHRPDPIECSDSMIPEDERKASCSLCAAEGESEYWQSRMEAEYGLERRPGRYEARRAAL